MKTSSNTKTLLTVKVDKKIKLAAQKVAEEVGIPLGTYINMTLIQFVRNKEVRFEGSHIPNTDTLQAIIDGEKDFKLGRLGKPVSNIAELKNRLNS